MKHAMPKSGNQLCEKREFAALNKSQGKLTSTQGNYNTSILDTWLIQNIIDICFLSQGLQ